MTSDTLLTLASMRSLSVELVREICGNLSTSDLKSIRLTCKGLASIGAEHLLPEVYLVFTVASFERLQQISLHPIISQHVRSFIYEGDRLDHYKDRTEWEVHLIDDDDWLARKPQHPDTTSDEDMRDYRRNLLLWASESKNSYTEKQLKEGWRMYEELYRDQENIMKSHMDYRIIAQAIFRFPKLESIKMSVDGKVCPPSIYLRHAHQAGLVRTFGDHAIYPFAPPGVRQFISILLPLYMPEKKAHAKLRILHAGSLSWYIFATHPSTASAMRKGLKHLSDLKLNFNTGHGEDGVQGGEVSECEENLRTTRNLQKFVAAAPWLRKLYVEFDIMGWGWQATDLEYVVGNYTWKYLEEVTFGMISAKEEQLLDFLGRHKGTLKRMTITGLVLQKGGSWDSTLAGIRQVLKWEKVCVHGTLMVAGEDSVWNLSLKGPLRSFTLRVEDFLMRRSEDNPLSFPEEA